MTVHENMAYGFTKQSRRPGGIFNSLTLMFKQFIPGYTFFNGLGLAHRRNFRASIPNISQDFFWLIPLAIDSLIILVTASLVSRLKCPLSGPLRPSLSFFLTRIARVLRLTARLWFRLALWISSGDLPRTQFAAVCRVSPDWPGLL